MAHPFHIRLSDDEMAALDQDREGRSRSAYIRWVLLQYREQTARLESIDAKLDRVLELIEKGGVPISASPEPDGQDEDLVRQSLDNLLGF